MEDEAKKVITDPDEKKPELDWTDDEFYEGAWSWIDECEVDEEDICLCGELIEDCKDAYDHMAKGY
ncbi:hypothetical protein OAG36_00175 [bacterium]|nr:hypothetical protein [bacterium]